MRAKLTPAFVARAQPAEGARYTTYWDDALSGFGLMVTRNGHKSYLVRDPAAGRLRQVHLKAPLTLREARKEAKAILGSVAKGGDPLGERRKAAAARSNSLKSICEEYLDRESKRKE